ncbi:SHOCT domain-containing protein [Desulfosporosinus sp. PR]|uniref:SHOCT domain-containing protein n=1 Tax=Candidatus Desulfosporosinus nitrosoreducens TaxID=3401928 RepID=UPI0027E77097|nr:SHOCT domain-containing protein [Desulfosporosinus sp. PR]MDQ7095993.1 SHOCT domain-containing protein [Desulfosporosinus sp. PR]
MLGLLLIVFCVGAFFHYHRNGCYFQQTVNNHQDALGIVRERYARGEINSEEFNERRRALEEGAIKK